MGSSRANAWLLLAKSSACQVFDPVIMRSLRGFIVSELRRKCSGNETMHQAILGLRDCVVWVSLAEGGP